MEKYNIINNYNNNNKKQKKLNEVCDFYETTQKDQYKNTSCE